MPSRSPLSRNRLFRPDFSRAALSPLVRGNRAPLIASPEIAGYLAPGHPAPSPPALFPRGDQQSPLPRATAPFTTRAPLMQQCPDETTVKGLPPAMPSDKRSAQKWTLSDRQPGPWQARRGSPVLFPRAGSRQVFQGGVTNSHPPHTRFPYGSKFAFVGFRPALEARTSYRLFPRRLRKIAETPLFA